MSIQVKVTFNDGSGDYDLPIVQSVSDPKEAMKATVIRGTRGDGALVIPGGKKSIDIQVKGKIYAVGYVALTALIATMKSSITTDPATLTLKHNIGEGWVTDWAYTVRRIEEISFPSSKRINIQDYNASFLVVNF